VVEIDEFAVFCRCYIFVVLEIMSTLLYIMTTIRSGFLLTPIRMTLNDLECPIHLKARLADVTLDLRMLGISELTMRD